MLPIFWYFGPEWLGEIRIKVEIFSGCISGLRIDINDPRLIITGSITGELEGLYLDSSYLRLAVGNELIYQNPMTKGDILIDIPIGEHLPLFLLEE